MIDPPVSHDGRALVEAAMAGDRVALRSLWEQHRRWVAAVIIAHKPASADTDDLLQEVALAVLGKVHTVQDAAAFPGWLRMVAMNMARLAGRKVAAGPRLVREDADDPRRGVGGVDSGVADAAAALAHDQEAGRVMALAMTLPDDYREPLLLKAVKGLSYRQIGEILGLPETTIETRIARGRRMLREKASGPTAAAGERAGATERVPARIS